MHELWAIPPVRLRDEHTRTRRTQAKLSGKLGIRSKMRLLRRLGVHHPIRLSKIGEVDEMNNRMVEVYEGYRVDERFVHLLPADMVAGLDVNAMISVDARLAY